MLGFLFGAAALVGSLLMFQLVVALSLSFLWGTLLVAGTFIAFGALSLKASECVGRQVVLPAQNSHEIPGERFSLEAPGWGMRKSRF